MKLENKKTIANKRRKEIMNINKKKVTTKSPVAIINNQPIFKEYEMKVKKLQVTFIFMLILTTLVFGQSNDLKIFGYFQNNFEHWEAVTGGIKRYDVNSFLSQQMNVFLQKNINPELSAFVNLEFTNSFSSKENIGNFKIEEVWLKYSPSSYINVKGGILIPRFNNFNEIKNRTVLLPYIFRPIAYETYFFRQMGTGEFVPTSANLQVYGELLNSDVSVNYAAFFGNSETPMLNDNNDIFAPGQDFTPYKLYGGRLGLEYENLQIGASVTNDRKNLDVFFNGFSTFNLNLGNVQRTRVGGYLNYSLLNFELEAEAIKVYYDLSQKNKDSLAAIPTRPKSFDKEFYHVNLLYNFSDKIAAYAGYDYLKGRDNSFMYGGLNVYNFGSSYKVTDAVILKAQYVYQSFEINRYGIPMPGTRNDYLLGASVSF